MTNQAYINCLAGLFYTGIFALLYFLLSPAVALLVFVYFIFANLVDLHMKS